MNATDGTPAPGGELILYQTGDGQTVLNKLHFAVTGRTAPELIAERAASSHANAAKWLPSSKG